MITKTVILFLFGATIASAQFMPRLIRPTTLPLMPYVRSNGCPSDPALAPVICQFMQPSLNFKPQLIAPSTYIPPLVVEKCDKPELEIKLPALEHIVIPEAPILPPITVPKFPVPVIAEPMPPVPIVEPCEPATVAVSSAVSVPVAPVLPTVEMPALSEIVEYHGAGISEAVLNEIDYQSMLGVHVPAVYSEPIPSRPLAPIPPAPILPPAPLPEIPVRVEVPAPIRPPMVIEEPCITDIVVPEPMLPLPAKLPVPVPMPGQFIMAEPPMPFFPVPEPAIIADPCEPVIPRGPLVIPSALPAPGPVLFPGRVMINRNMFASVPYMRRV